MARLSGFCLLVCALIAIVPSDASKYCNLESCDEPHTMCKYSQSPARMCYNIERVGMTSTEQEQVVERHNQLRAKVAKGQERRGANGPQPAAANIGPLKWDNELAEIAQRWANQCQFGHDECRNVERFHVGQNVASASTSGPNNGDLQKMVQGWYDEVKDFNRNQIRSFTDLYNNGEQVGHYTQLIWADTKLVGCGSIRYQEPGWNTTYLVCNYGPAGNIKGQAIYKIR